MTDICTAPVKQRLFGINYSDLKCPTEIVHLIGNVDPSAMGEFRYVVTPNADHITRLARSPELRDIYNRAWLCLNDSRVVQLLMRAGGIELPVIRGSDIAAELLRS